MLEKGIVYVAPLMERIALPAGVSGAANPKSSTGRLDIFTRLIVDGSDAFDAVPEGYAGPLFAEISPRSFSVRVRQGAKLNQLRFREGAGPFALDAEALSARHEAAPLVDGALSLRDGLIVHAGLEGAAGEVVGFRAIKNSDVIDVDRVAGYAARRLLGAFLARADRRLVLDPDEFYILASRERMRIPADLAAEMAPIDPAIGEFRVHYAGFFDPGFGHGPDGRPSRPRRARGALARRALPARGRPAGRPPRLRTPRRRPRRPLRRRRDLQLPAPGPEAVEAFRGVGPSPVRERPRGDGPEGRGALGREASAFCGFA